MTYDEMMAYCRRHRDSDGFCRCNSSCSGPTYSNLACDHPYPEGMDVFRGAGCGCRFVVKRER